MGRLIVSGETLDGTDGTTVRKTVPVGFAPRTGGRSMTAL